MCATDPLLGSLPCQFRCAEKRTAFLPEFVLYRALPQPVLRLQLVSSGPPFNGLIRSSNGAKPVPGKQEDVCLEHTVPKRCSQKARTDHESDFSLDALHNLGRGSGNLRACQWKSLVFFWLIFVCSLISSNLARCSLLLCLALFVGFLGGAM